MGPNATHNSETLKEGRKVLVCVDFFFIIIIMADFSAWYLGYSPRGEWVTAVPVHLSILFLFSLGVDFLEIFASQRQNSCCGFFHMLYIMCGIWVLQAFYKCKVENSQKPCLIFVHMHISIFDRKKNEQLHSYNFALLGKIKVKYTF